MEGAAHVKELVAEYYKLQKQSRMLGTLRKKIIAEIKRRGLTGTAFRFADGTLKYATYYRYSEISKEHVREILAKYYKEIDAEEFINRLWAGRHRSAVETIRVDAKKG